MATTSTLIVYNDALREIGGQPLLNTTTPNTRLQELSGAFSHAVEYMLAKKDWSFARRRSTLTGVVDSSFPPYVYRYVRPSDFLRKCWVKTSAADAHQVDHAEVGAVIYGMASTALLEYMADHADNYLPENWPPHFTRCVVIYLAQLVAPKLARAGAGDLGTLEGKLQAAIGEADAYENIFVTNVAIPAARQPVMRRAIEILGQQLAGSVAIHSATDRLRWHMMQAWDHSVRHVLEMGAWNFAAKRTLFEGGLTGDSLMPASTGGLVEGYAVAPAAAAASPTSIAGYQYGYPLPDDFLHKIWIRSNVLSDAECPHQIVGAFIFTDYDPCVMEYVALSSFAVAPENWSASFTEVVAAYLAHVVAPELMVDEGGKRARVAATGLRDRTLAVYERALGDAKLRDAIQQYPVRPALGRFVKARFGGTLSGPRMRNN